MTTKESVAGDPPRLTPAEQAVLAAAQSGATSDEIAAKAGIHPGYAATVLRRLRAAGLVESRQEPYVWRARYRLELVELPPEAP